MTGVLLLLLVTLLAVTALGFIVYGVKMLQGGRVAGSISSILLGVLLFVTGLLAGAVAAAMQGYQAFTREAVAATVEVTPTGVQQFEALFTFPDGTMRRFELAGDELYLDAQIVKWHSGANFLGLHTAYEFDRVAGRYRLLDHEQQRARTVYSLKSERPLGMDIFALARRYPSLQALVDAEYGSATFVPAEDVVRYEVRVSTSGLLARPID